MPSVAMGDVDLWTDRIAGGLAPNGLAPCGLANVARVCRFADVVVSEAFDTFGGAGGMANARTFDVFGYALVACHL